MDYSYHLYGNSSVGVTVFFYSFRNQNKVCVCLCVGTYAALPADCYESRAWALFTFSGERSWPVHHFKYCVILKFCDSFPPLISSVFDVKSSTLCPKELKGVLLKVYPENRFISCFGSAAACRMRESLAAKWRKLGSFFIYLFIFFKHSLMNFSVNSWIKVQGSRFARQANGEPCYFRIKNSSVSWAVLRRVRYLDLRSALSSHKNTRLQHTTT